MNRIPHLFFIQRPKIFGLYLLVQCFLFLPLFTWANERPLLEKHRSTEHFRVHYTLEDKAHRPAGREANAQAAEHYVFMVQHYLEAAYTKLVTERNYRSPIGDGTIGGGEHLYDVYIQGLANGENGMTKADPPSDLRSVQTSTYIIISNQLPLEDIYGGNALAATCTHELFHAIQNAYYCSALAEYPNAAVKVSKSTSLREGTAVWAETLLSKKDQQANRFPNKNYYSYLNTKPGLLSHPEKALLLHEEAHHSQYAYSTVFFWVYLSEQFGEDIIQKIWEANASTAKGMTTIGEEMDILDTLLQEKGGLQQVLENFYIALYLLHQEAGVYQHYQTKYARWRLKEHHFYQQFLQKKYFLPALSPSDSPIRATWDCQASDVPVHCELTAMGGLGIHHLAPPTKGKYRLYIRPLFGTPNLQTNDLMAVLIQEKTGATIEVMPASFQVVSNQISIPFELIDPTSQFILLVYRLQAPEIAQLLGKKTIQYQISLEKAGEY